MSSHNSDTCNLEKGGIMANSEHKLWLPEVTSGHQPPMTRQKSELGLVRSAQFSRESKSPDLCMVYKCWQYIPKKCFSKHFVSQVGLAHEREHSYSRNTGVGDIQRVKSQMGFWHWEICREKGQLMNRKGKILFLYREVKRL